MIIIIAMEDLLEKKVFCTQLESFFFFFPLWLLDPIWNDLAWCFMPGSNFLHILLASILTSLLRVTDVGFAEALSVLAVPKPPLHLSPSRKQKKTGCDGEKIKKRLMGWGGGHNWESAVWNMGAKKHKHFTYLTQRHSKSAFVAKLVNQINECLGIRCFLHTPSNAVSVFVPSTGSSGSDDYRIGVNGH